MRTKSEFLTEDDEFDGEKAYGALIGTLLVCAWVEVVLAFIKPEVCIAVTTFYRPIDSVQGLSVKTDRLSLSTNPSRLVFAYGLAQGHGRESRRVTMKT